MRDVIHNTPRTTDAKSAFTEEQDYQQQLERDTPSNTELYGRN